MAGVTAHGAPGAPFLQPIFKLGQRAAVQARTGPRMTRPESAACGARDAPAGEPGSEPL
jgi:hypothetical protein